MSIIHPPLNEVVDGIIKGLNPRQKKPFGEVWQGPFKYGAGSANNQHYQTDELRRCLKFMVRRNLLRVDTGTDLETADWNTVVWLGRRGERVRENGGWLLARNRNGLVDGLGTVWMVFKEFAAIAAALATVGSFVVGWIAIQQGQTIERLDKQVDRLTRRIEAIEKERIHASDSTVAD